MLTANLGWRGANTSNLSKRQYWNPQLLGKFLQHLKYTKSGEFVGLGLRVQENCYKTLGTLRGVQMSYARSCTYDSFRVNASESGATCWEGRVNLLLYPNP